MAATYDTSRARALDRVRARIGDTGNYDKSATGEQDVSSLARLSDAEINSLVDRHGEEEATAQAAEELAAFYGMEPKSMGQSNGVTFSFGDRADFLLKLAARIRSNNDPGQGGRYGHVSATVSVPNDVQF